MNSVSIPTGSRRLIPHRKTRIKRNLRNREKLAEKVAEPPARQLWPATLMKILYLGANPPGTAPLRLHDEERAIKLELRSARHRCFDLVSCWASEADDLIRELREAMPVIAHVSGHGCEGGERPPAEHGAPRDAVVDPAPEAGCEGALVLHARDGSVHVVPYELVRKMFELAGSSVKLVVLTACATEPLARRLAAHVDCAIAMTA